MANHLAGETSPYLLQHADNPVDWRPWGEEALALARREGRPILLSIGYSACHWCHVMAHESFEDPETAQVLNRLFVNIKVDREERPDLDQIYQTAHQALTGRAGGWPLTVFLTPDGMPFFAGTYFPRLPRHGLPAFIDLCERVVEAYRSRPEAVAEQNRSLADILAATLPRPPAGSVALDGEPLRIGRESLLRHFDSRFGGFGGAPKFPHAPDLELLLRLGAAGDGRARGAVLNTLTRMAEGGIYDQVGGGFCRYSVDERWEIPHFEKMLYDNGLLLALYADAWVLAGEPLHARVVEETAAWVMREMQLPAGGYASSLDADSEGEEGRYYLWQPEEVAALLTPGEWQALHHHWGLDGPPNFENAHWHLKATTPLAAEALALRDSARARLLAARESRVRPGRDDKVLTAWNALMITGMARAARIFDRPDWRDSARRALDFLQSALWQPASGGGGVLLATCRDGHAHLKAYLDDYALLLAAVLEMLQADFRPADLEFARCLADDLLARFEDREHGGFHFTAHDHETLIHRPKPAHDNALPAGNGIAARALTRLGRLLGEPRYLAAAERTLALFWPQLLREGGGMASQLLALREVLEPADAVILRGPRAGLADWSLRLARLPSMKGLAGLVLPIPGDAGRLPGMLDKPCLPEVNAWVCSGVSCHAPVNDFDELRGVLQAA